MNFFTAIKTVFSKYADFNGVASRPEYWWWWFFTVIAAVALGSMAHTRTLRAASVNVEDFYTCS